MNMGVVARLIYDNYVCDGVQGLICYRILCKAMVRHGILILRFKKSILYIWRNGKVKSGYLSLTPVENNTSYQAYILI